MSNGAIKLKPEQNQGFAITAPGEARLYSTTIEDAGILEKSFSPINGATTNFVEFEGGQTCQMPVNHPLFPAAFRGTVDIEGVPIDVGALSTTATIPPDVIDTVAKSFNLNPAELRDILANMGPGQKYDLLAKDAEAKIAEAIDGGSLARFLRSAKGKVWFMNKRAAIENLMLKGVPLSVTMASLLGVSKLVHMAGINDPAVSFVLVIKGAEFAGLPVEVAMSHLYDRIVLKRPFDRVLKRFVVRDAAHRVAGELTAELPVKVGLGSKMSAALLRHVMPAGSSYLAKTWSVTTWPVRTLYGMGEGLVFANLYDAFLKDSVKEKLGGGIAEFGGFVAFFGKQIGDWLSGGYLSKGLGLPVIKQLLGGAAAFVGAGFTSFFLDSFVVDPIESGRKHANYMGTVSTRAAEELFKDNWFAKVLGFVAGKSVLGHLCSGRFLGVFVTLGDDMWVGLGNKTKYDTCEYARKSIKIQDILSMRDISVGLKNRFKGALVTGDIEDANVDIWKERVDEGWFEHVDISPVQATNSRLFEAKTFQWLEVAKLYDTDEADEIMSFLSDEFLGYKNENVEEDEKRELARIPMDMTIIPNDKRGEFLNWLGGEQEILRERRKDLHIKLLLTDIRRVAGAATDEDLKLLELGSEAGFASKYHKKFQADGEERELDGYDFSRSVEYYKALAEIVQSVAIQSDGDLMEKLQLYSQQRYRMVIAVANGGSFQCTEEGCGDEEAMAVAPYVRDLQILDPLLIDPRNELAVLGQGYFLEDYLDKLPRDAGFEHAMNEYAQRWESYIKARISENIAVRKALGIQYTGDCVADTVCIDEKYSETEFNSLAYFTREDFGKGNDLPMSLGDDVIDRSLAGMPALIKAFYNYAVLGSDAPESIAKGVIGEDGSLLDKARFARWVARPVKVVYEKMTGNAVFAPEDKKMWEDEAVQLLEAKLNNVRSLLTRKWLMAIGERAADPGREMRDLLDEYINRPQNIVIRRDLGVIAAYSRGFEREFLKKIGVVRAFSDFWRIGRAEEIVRLIETGIITPDGRLGELRAIEAWIKDDVLEAGDKLIEENSKHEANIERIMERTRKEIEDKKDEFVREVGRYNESAKRGIDDHDQVDKIKDIESSIMNGEVKLKKYAMVKLQIDAMKAEIARLKALE